MLYQVRQPLARWLANCASSLLLMLVAFHQPVTLAASPAVGRATIDWEQTPAHARLRVNGQTLIDQPGAHLSPPLLSPDGRQLAVVIVPTGSETAPLARTLLFDTASGRRLGEWAGHTARWTAADELTFQAEEEAITLQTTTKNLRRTRLVAAAGEPLPTSAVPGAMPLLAFPETIRVLHHASNGCRDLPAGQIDVIPFEEYVARAVPAEMPAFWDFAALAAQAVAVRSYAWRQILVGRPDYDVTDWANFQVMCDQRYPASDAATAATAGQILSQGSDEAGWPILAMYSAENGHPTLTNPELAYLQAVPDLLSLGQPRYGHGYGLSQWGAQRRARAGQSYRQILGHYYTGVVLRNALQPDESLSALIRPAPGDWLTSSALHWQTLPPNPTADLSIQLTSTMGLTDTVVLSGERGSWRNPVLAVEAALITVTLWLAGERQDELAVQIDTTPPPPPQLTLPRLVLNQAISLPVEPTFDNQIGLHPGWIWQGETLSHTFESGAQSVDLAASNGLAWQALADVHRAGVWYGPYTRELAAGHHYRALFWLRTSIPLTLTTELAPTPLARLDVTDEGGVVVLGLRDLWFSDFAPGMAYQPVAVDFYLFDPPAGLEFRVAWPGLADLALDRVEVWRIAEATGPETAELSWYWPGAGEHTLAAVAFDPAGNLSIPATISTTVDLALPAVRVTASRPITGQVELHWQASDDLGVARVEIELQSGGEWVAHPASPLTLAQGTLTLAGEEEGPLRIRVRAVDQAGRVGDWVEVEPFAAANRLLLPYVVAE